MQQNPAARIGSRILLSLNGKPTAWQIVGTVLEVGGGAHVSSAGYVRASASGKTSSDIRLVTSTATAEERDRVVHAAEAALDQAGLIVQRSMPLDRLYAASAMSRYRTAC